MTANQHHQRCKLGARGRPARPLLVALLLLLATAASAQTPPAETPPSGLPPTPAGDEISPSQPESLPSQPESLPGQPESLPGQPESLPLEPATEPQQEAAPTSLETGSPSPGTESATGGATLEETAIGFLAAVAARDFERADAFLLPEGVCGAARGDAAACLDYVAESRARLRALGSRVPESFQPERVVVVAGEGPSGRLVEVLAPGTATGAGLRLRVVELGGRFYVVLGVEAGSPPRTDDADGRR